MKNPLAPGIAVKVENLTKTYGIYFGWGRGWLLSKLFPFVSKDKFLRKIEAVRGIDLEIRRGEVLGIIGRNGAGKSTLLRVIAGLSSPTTGTVRVAGKIRALLSLGVGFEPHFTGRENIIFGSMAMGIPKRVAEKRVREIIDFAELSDYLDVPVKFYSSGMRARLAAAVAFQETPEILIIDESLSAGDGYFENKCLKRMTEICRSGSTILFVSHGISLIERLCSRTVIIDDGRIIGDGLPSDMVAQYRKLLVEQEKLQLESGEEGKTLRPSIAPANILQYGQGDLAVMDAYMSGPDGKPRRLFDHGEPLELHLIIRTRRPLSQVRYFFELYSEDYGVRLAEFGSNYLHAETGKHAFQFLENLDGTYHLKMTWPRNPLGGGSYYWAAFFAPPSPEIPYESAALYYCTAQRLCPFRSVSFPGETWALNRRIILEPETEFEISSCAQKEYPVSSKP